MSVYVVAQLAFTDEARHRRYQERFADVFRTSGGRLLAADEAPVLFEGEWQGDKIVLMAFDAEEDALRFLGSERYQEISQDRRAGARTVALLVRGW